MEQSHHKEQHEKITNHATGILAGVTVLFVIIPVLISFFLVQKPKIVQAGTDDNVSGYAWSGVVGGGFIRMNNCDDPHDAATCTGIDYGVNIDPSGNWSGRGWSSNFGWVDFGGDASCPTTNGVSSPGGTDVTGFAFVESVAGTTSLQNGGFSGCINMAGSGNNLSPTDGVSIGTLGQMSGFAWSGDDVLADLDGDGIYDAPYGTLNGTPDVGLGWIDFSGVIYHEAVTNPVITITGYPDYICPGDSIQTVNFDISDFTTASVDGDAFDQNAIESGLSGFLSGPLAWPFEWTACGLNPQGQCNTLSQGTGSAFPLLPHNGSTAPYTLEAVINASNYLPGSTSDQEVLFIEYLPLIDDRCEGIDPTGEICGNGIDDNGNGVIDEGCSASLCTDGIDNDGDTLVDAQDIDECPLVIPIFKEV
jgi:hypothetical protein